MSRLYLSATRKSSGKTTVAVGLCAAMNGRGRRVRPFKKGPDYIDPMWLRRATGNPCINLDFHTMGMAEIHSRFRRHAQGGDLAVIEGNKGLYDGLDPGGGDSNAAMAKALSAPVLLVLDARGMTRGAAPLLLGYRDFDPAVNIAGVVLNNIGGARHESKLRAAIERYTDVAVVGAVHFDREMVIAERHLGLVTDRENAAAGRVIRRITDAITAQVDLDAVASIADRAAPFAPVDLLPDLPAELSAAKTPSADLTIGIARDSAFGFYYADDLSAFADQGARLIPFDALHDTTLPDVDGLYIGGGFPETHGAALARNGAMRAAVKNFVECGRPVYAECGGLMYLAQSVTRAGRTYDMAGALPLRIEMSERPVGRGYVVLEETGHSPWPPVRGNGAAASIPAHEFHYSRPERLAGPADDAKFAYRVLRGHGMDGRHDGLVHGNVLANYSHFRNTESNPWVARFVGFVRAHKS